MAQKVNALLKDKQSVKDTLLEICLQCHDTAIADTQEMAPENDPSENELQSKDQYTADELINCKSEDEEEKTD